MNFLNGFIDFLMQVSCNIRKCRKRGLKKVIPRSDLIYWLVVCLFFENEQFLECSGMKLWFSKALLDDLK